MRKQRKEEGFSLIELLIVVAIILIIAAIAIPNLVRAKMSANQASAVSSERTITTGQTQYQSTYPLTGYAVSLVTLGTGTASIPPTPCPAIPTALAACQVDGVLTGAATIGKSGYNIDSAGQPNAAGVNTTFVTQDGPMVFNSSGLLMHCSVEDGVIKQNPNTGGLSGLPTFTYAQCQTAAAPWTPLAQ